MDKIQFYNKWFEAACREITQLKINDHLFWEVQEVIRESRSLKGKGSSFFQWMGHAYISDVTVRLRRISDSGSNARSFMKFLERLKNEPALLSRERYVALYNREMQEIANGDFDRIAGKGMSAYSSSRVSEDIKSLKAMVERVNEYTNHHVTHLAAEDVLGKDYNPPSFDDVRIAINGVCELALKYKLLYQANGQTEILPTWTYNWKSVFEVPWISKD